MNECYASIIDNFYEDPHGVRKLALSLKFSPRENATYPGGEAYTDAVDWLAARQRLFSCVAHKLSEKPLEGKNFRQGKFRLASAADNATRPDGVHQDQQRYSGIVYLSRNQDVAGGIGLYKCRRTGQIAMTPYWIKSICEWSGASPGDKVFIEYLQSYMKDWSNWEKIGELPMRFNRAVVLMARCFHASTGLFGVDKESSRLSQHFELYV